MQLEIRELHRKLGLTVIFVTHDQGEALTMSDRVAVLNLGKIEQLDTPSGLYDRPRTRFVAEFIGETNLLEGTLHACADGVARVALALGPTISCRTDLTPTAGAPVLVSVRPERLHLGDSSAHANSLPVRVEDEVYHGDHVRLHLSSGEQRLVAKADRRDTSRAMGSQAHAGFAAEDCTLVLP
jgi:putative spermidine/putrescine transport system ATP-binding protein